MKREGFTLIEVIVVMAIVAIMAGIMVPFVYRMWEGNEIELTRERMLDLKRAMVGDPRMIQNGIRTNFGYAGDNGQLPLSIDDLINYMPAGFDPGKFKKDAWRNNFVYTTFTRYEDGMADPLGRRVRATLQSAGPNGTLGDTDDINALSDPDLQVGSNEVVPAEKILGNVNVVIYNSIAATYDPVPDPADPAKTIGWTPNCPTQTIPNNYYYTRAYIDWVPFGSYTADAQSDCIPLNNIGQIYCRTSKEYSQSFSNDVKNSHNIAETANLPIGKVVFWAALYRDNMCNNEITGTKTQGKTIFISDGQNALSLNLSFQIVYP
jgi:prepilin-type N-terminal cleavage/methylation domain-containing protein